MSLANLSIEAAYEAGRRERLDRLEAGINQYKKLGRRFIYYLDCYMDIFLTDEYVLRSLKEITEYLQYLQSEVDVWDGPHADQMRADIREEFIKCRKRLHHINPVIEAIHQYRFHFPY